MATWHFEEEFPEPSGDDGWFGKVAFGTDGGTALKFVQMVPTLSLYDKGWGPLCTLTVQPASGDEREFEWGFDHRGLSRAERDRLVGRYATKTFGPDDGNEFWLDALCGEVEAIADRVRRDWQSVAMAKTLEEAG